MPSRSRTSGSSSNTAGTRVARSVWPAASIRRAASARASGSRSRPTSRRPGWASSIAIAWPARPRVASTRTAPSAAQAGASSSVTRSRRTGTCTGDGNRPGAAALPVVLIVGCLSDGPWGSLLMVPRAAAHMSDAGVPENAIGRMGRAGREVGPGGRAVGRSGGAQWGGGSGVGLCPTPRKAYRPGWASRPPRGPPGVGEERQVVPRGGGRSPAGRPWGRSACSTAERGPPCRSEPSRGEGDWGPDPVEPRGRRLVRAWLAELRRAAGSVTTTGRPGSRQRRHPLALHVGVGGLLLGHVGLPVGGVPDLEAGVHADDDDVAVQPRVFPQARRDGDAAGLVRLDLDHRAEAHTGGHAGACGVGGSHGGHGGALLGDPGHGEAVDAALLALLDHHAVGHLVAEPDRESEPALLVETQRVAADEHRITPRIGPPVGPTGTLTVPVSPPGDTVTH